MTHPEFLSIADVCVRWGVHRNTIRKWRAAGLLPVVVIGRKTVRIAWCVVQAFEQQHLHTDAH